MTAASTYPWASPDGMFQPLQSANVSSLAAALHNEGAVWPGHSAALLARLNPLPLTCTDKSEGRPPVSGITLHAALLGPPCRSAGPARAPEARPRQTHVSVPTLGYREHELSLKIQACVLLTMNLTKMCELSVDILTRSQV